MATGETEKAGERVAIVAGLRTPFAKADTDLADMRTVDLGTAVVKELVRRSGISPREITLCVYGQVIPSLDWLSIAREVVLRAGLPHVTDAFSVSRACATSIQALTSATESILAGQHDVAVVGGADSMSDVPIGVGRRLAVALRRAQKARTLADRLGAFARIGFGDLMPPGPGFTREPTTGELMGEAAEKMAKANGIDRARQDRLALLSHENASRAWRDGHYANEVMHVVVPQTERVVSTDNVVRTDTSLEALGLLPPVFDKAQGTVSAGNSSPLTDGASALLVMRESKARALGIRPLGFVRSWAYAAVDPGWQLLMGPVFAAPLALERARLRLADMDLIEMHEAFAAQVASHIDALGSQSFARERLGRSEAIGEVDPAKLNVNGGSIALGHPFGATGGRMVLSALNELERRKARFALLTVCAAGGLGAALVLERS